MTPRGDVWLIRWRRPLAHTVPHCLSTYLKHVEQFLSSCLSVRVTKRDLHSQLSKFLSSLNVLSNTNCIISINTSSKFGLINRIMGHGWSQKTLQRCRLKCPPWFPQAFGRNSIPQWSLWENQCNVQVNRSCPSRSEKSPSQLWNSHLALNVWPEDFLLLH